MTGSLFAIALGKLLISQAAEEKLPILAANEFKVGQEFIWVFEQEAKATSFGGKDLSSKMQVFIRQKIVDVSIEPSAKGRPSSRDDADQKKSHRAGGKLRIASWDFDKPYADEPRFVRWEREDDRTEYEAERYCVAFAMDNTVPHFSFEPIGLIGISKPGDFVTRKFWCGPYYEIGVKANRVVTMDGYKCLEVEAGPSGKMLYKMYYRLTDGLLQRVAEVKRDKELTVNGVLGKGYEISRGYRLDKMPPNQAK